MSTETAAAPASTLSAAIAQVRADMAGTMDKLLAGGESTPGNDLITMQFGAGWDNGAVLSFSASPIDPTQNIWVTVCSFSPPDLTDPYVAELTLAGSPAGEGGAAFGIFRSQQFTVMGAEVAGTVAGYVSSSDTPFNYFQYQQNFIVG